jgi:hypothetical protein
MILKDTYRREAEHVRAHYCPEWAVEDVLAYVLSDEQRKRHGRMMKSMRICGGACRDNLNRLIFSTIQDGK